MKMVLVGPGAMGSLFAALLSKSKEEVWLLDKDKERSDKISRQGINLEGVSGNWKVKVQVTSFAQDIGRADLIIIICLADFSSAARGLFLRYLFFSFCKLMVSIAEKDETQDRDRILLRS